MSGVAAMLHELGVRRMLLAIHDASFPVDLDEDLGRGAPATRAGERLFAFARGLGFTGIQLGPAGQTSRGNASPYDAQIFARHLGGIALGSFAPGGPFEGLVDDGTRARAVLDPGGGPIAHARAHDASEAVVAAAYDAYVRGARRDLEPRLAAFVAAQAGWLDPSDGRLVFGQWLAHAEHARVRERAAAHGLALYGDLQIGYAVSDARAHRSVFLAGYAMGAPPSRTNPDGQPWGYPVLDPESESAAGLIRSRFDKVFAEYDSVRIDHPHGLVCPWVYRTGDGDQAAAVRAGARLYESPDLDDHPGLARYAIARGDQLDRARARHHDDWVRELEDAQVARYARLFDALAEAAARHGRELADVSCEVLSTMPMPLGRVLARYGLGRWRVTQKANLDEPSDVYRAENAAPADWVMLGNHDTPSIFGLIRDWPAATRDAWARHLTARLALDATTAAALDRDDGLVAAAMLAELFASRAENVSIFFADLFGYPERFNMPGTYGPHNWVLRLPADFAAVYDQRLARGAALDLPLALRLARAART